jgi:large subunit ribosomal protein L7/L12
MADLCKNASSIMDLVKELSIVELNDLVKAMEEEFGVSAAAPVMMAGGAEGGAEESSTKTVELTSAGASKIAVIKVIREITGLGLKEAKGLADNGGAIKEDCDAAEADEIKTKLEGAGASVELK